MPDIDALSSDEQAILLWMAEADARVNEPLAVSLVDFPSERVSTAVARLVHAGFLHRELPLVNRGVACLDGLCAELTRPGVQLVAELLRRCLRQVHPKSSNANAEAWQHQIA